MIVSASQLLYDRIGRPPVEGLEGVESVCWVCGGILSSGMRVGKWMGSGFTDHNRCAAPGSEYICPACVYVCARTSPVPGRPPGKCSACEGTLVVTKPSGKLRKGAPCTKCDGTGMNASGSNFRNMSHLLDATSYVNASKGEKPAILAFLMREHRGPWFATIADSGQIHMLPFAPVNETGTRRGSVLFERQIVMLPRLKSVGWDLVQKMADLLTAGATKEEIESGEYGPRAWQLCELRLSGFEDHWSGKRGSPWFSLALWLAQRDEAVVAERIENGKAKRTAKGKVADADGGSAAGTPPSVPADTGEEHPQELGHPDVPMPIVNHDDNESGGVVHGDAPRAEDRKRQPVQLRLFG